VWLSCRMRLRSLGRRARRRNGRVLRAFLLLLEGLEDWSRFVSMELGSLWMELDPLEGVVVGRIMRREEQVERGSCTIKASRSVWIFRLTEHA
jgi:hypothetical protein